MSGAGKYRHKITLLAPITRYDAAGQADTTARQSWRTWAEIKTQSAREIVRNGLVESETTYIINMRYRDDINESWQISHCGQLLQISKVLDIDQLHVELQVIASEVH